MKKIDKVIKTYNESVRGHPPKDEDEAARILKAISLELGHKKLLQGL